MTDVAHDETSVKVSTSRRIALQEVLDRRRYNLLAGGQRLEHLEVRRNDEVYLDALGAQRIPDPTTAGDFCRRFTGADVERLMEIFNETRLRAWKQQPDDFFEEAFIDADGALAPSDSWCEAGVDIA